jgi:2-aminobenzoate-CoA ligase
MPYSAHVDTFTRDNLPPPEQQPEFLFDLPELKFPEHLNCSDPLLDRPHRGRARRPPLHPGPQPALDLC